MPGWASQFRVPDEGRSMASKYVFNYFFDSILASLLASRGVRIITVFYCANAHHSWVSLRAVLEGCRQVVSGRSFFFSPSSVLTHCGRCSAFKIEILAIGLRAKIKLHAQLTTCKDGAAQSWFFLSFPFTLLRRRGLREVG